MTDRPKLGAMFAAPATERPAALAGLLAADPEPTDRPHPAPAAGHDANRSTASDRSAGKTRSSRGKGNIGVDPGVANAVHLTSKQDRSGRTRRIRAHRTAGLREQDRADARQRGATGHRGPRRGASGALANTESTSSRSFRHHCTAAPSSRAWRANTAEDLPQDAVTLDNIASEWGAPSRSALVNEALRRYVKNATKLAPQELAEPITN